MFVVALHFQLAKSGPVASSADSESGSPGLSADADQCRADHFRNHVREDTSLDSDEAKRRTKVIDSFASSDDTLRDPAASCVLSSIKIGSRVWLGESISSIGTTAVSKSKLRGSFGDEWAQASVTGIVLGKGANKKIRVRWTILKDTEDMEYGYNHNRESFIISVHEGTGIRRNITVSAARGRSWRKESMDDMLLAVSSASTVQSASHARLEELSIHGQSDILSASRSAEMSGMKRKRAHNELEQDENPRKESPRKERPKCSHGKLKRYCKECGGSAFCGHGKRQAECKECGGSSICSHGKHKQYCKECGGSAFCSHGKRRAECKECGGSSICSHGKHKRYCKKCGGSAFCSHDKHKQYRKECGGSAFCSHRKRKSRCKECRPPASTQAAPEGGELPVLAAAGEAAAASEAAGAGSAEWLSAGFVCDTGGGGAAGR